ncbi:MAG TPA: methylated-DNA--[protein]-cysteine S-methyltransferase [Pseudonocardiaceae bacterium]|nr:methylated-DNA--[protein]-cysteine S-methyltransferase [Pseudonocardiaceae bacterium]
MTEDDGSRTGVAVLTTPIGGLTVAASDAGVVSCGFAEADAVAARLAEAGIDPRTEQAGHWRAEAVRELTEYFAGARREFEVPVDLRLAASGFDRTVLAGLGAVGYGTTTSYGRLGASVGLPAAAVRGVGAALGRNPVWIMVGCHRVVGADGSLTGYAGGLSAKRWLLDLESDLPQLALDL